MNKQKYIKQFRKKFVYGNGWKTYAQGNSPALIEPYKVEQFHTTALEEVERETIDKAFDWIWDGWNLDLANKDRAKENFKSKYTTSGGGKE